LEKRYWLKFGINFFQPK